MSAVLPSDALGGDSYDAGWKTCGEEKYAGAESYDLPLHCINLHNRGLDRELASTMSYK